MVILILINKLKISSNGHVHTPLGPQQGLFPGSNWDCCPPLSRRATTPIGNQATIPSGALGGCEHGLIVFCFCQYEIAIKI